MAPAYDILKLYSAATAVASPGVVHDLGDVKQEWELVAFFAGTSFSMQLMGSLDGVNFYTMGPAVVAATAAAPAEIAGMARWVRADLTAITAGTLTAELGFGGGL